MVVQKKLLYLVILVYFTDVPETVELELVWAEWLEEGNPVLTARRTRAVKRTNVSCTLVLFFLTAFLSTVSAVHSRKVDAVPAAVIVDESAVIRKIPKELFGFNHNWVQSERLVWDKRRNQVFSDFVHTLSGLPMPLNRMSGSVSQAFHWKKAIGPIEGRKPQQLAPHDQGGKKYFGLLEWIASTRLIDPEAEFSWVFNMKSENPADHADLVEFMVGDGQENINGGVDWARKRIQLGFAKPIKVTLWELGNELDWGKEGTGWSVEKYIAQSRQVIKAVRSVDPAAKIAMHTATAPWAKKRYFFRDWRSWHRKILTELGDEVDFITFHPYYLGVPTGAIEKYIDAIASDIGRITGSDRIKIYISEHAVWPLKPVKTSKYWYQTHSLGGVLGTAQFISRLVNRKEVVAAAYHCFSGGPWGLFYKNKTSGRLYVTGIYELYRMLGLLEGAGSLQARVTGKGTDVERRSLTFTAIAAKTEQGITLMTVNRDPGISRNVEFHFNKDYRLTRTVILTGDSLDSYNKGGKDEVYRVDKFSNDPGSFTRYIIAPKTLSVFILEEQKRGDI